MEDETTIPENSETPTPTAGDDPAPTEAAPAEPPAETPTPRPAIKVLTIPTAKIGAIKKAEREKGRLDAQRQYDDVAKKLGYDSHEQLMAALQEQHSGTSSRREAEPADDYVADPVAASEPSGDPALRRSRTVAQLTKDREKLLADRKKVNQARAHEARKAKALQEKLDAQQAEHELRFAAMRAGITDDGDVDYAVNCLRREIQGKAAEDLKGFDPAEYFGKKLRKARPYLYGEQTRGATSSPPPQETGTNGGPPAPSDPNVQTSGGEDPVKDARLLSQEAYAKLLRSRGLTLPSVGMPV